MEITLTYQEYPQNELSADDLELLEAAEAARKRAYAPYSSFTVGCALRMESGEIITGNNQENAAYPSGLCAERVALFAAGAKSNEAVHTLLVVARNSKGEIANAFPCGACRQVILEYDLKQPQPIRLLMQTSHEHIFEVQDAKAMLPFAFTPKAL